MRQLSTCQSVHRDFPICDLELKAKIIQDTIYANKSKGIPFGIYNPVLYLDHS